jgi:hypothetical protein
MQTPNVEAQRDAMKKLAFLVGKWTGEARIHRGPGETAELVQTEEAQYKLDGLILMIEGAGLNALGLLSYDDIAGTYHMRAYNDGRWLETDVNLVDGKKELTWGFTFGEIKLNSVLRINDQGEWTELHELIIGSQPARKYMELTVKPVPPSH